MLPHCEVTSPSDVWPRTFHIPWKYSLQWTNCEALIGWESWEAEWRLLAFIPPCWSLISRSLISFLMSSNRIYYLFTVEHLSDSLVATDSSVENINLLFPDFVFRILKQKFTFHQADMKSITIHPVFINCYQIFFFIYNVFIFLKHNRQFLLSGHLYLMNIYFLNDVYRWRAGIWIRR